MRSLLFLLALGSFPSQAATLAVESEFIDASTLRFETPLAPNYYFILEETSNLNSFHPLDLDLGTTALIWDVTFDFATKNTAFYRIGATSIFDPLDSDGDLIDDLYELARPEILDPLDPSDAQLDPDNNGLTHLQEYLRGLTDGDNPPQYLSREITTFNFGAPVEASLSREVTLFNLGEPTAPIEAISPEVSVYQASPGSGPLPFPQIPQAISRELTVYNLGSPSAPVEAISRSVSVYRANPGSGPPTVDFLPDVLSREVTIFNLGEPTAPIEAISREVSVFAINSQN